MMRVPVSAPTFGQSLSGANESAKPSVTRVDVNAEPVARKLAKLAGLAASGDPAWLQIFLLEKSSYRPCCGIPTVSWLVVSAMEAFALVPINTCIVLLVAKSN